MKKTVETTKRLSQIITLCGLFILIQSCVQKKEASTVPIEKEEVVTTSVTPEFYQLRPEVEKAAGYTHAVKIGNTIRIAGAVSMDDDGNPTAVGDMGQQIKNCYADLAKILEHYDCTFDDVVVENIFTTNMPLFLENAAYRNEIYTKQFPAGTWLGVKELVIPEFMIEIEWEVYKPE